uniref:Restriction endonuclease subunit M n=1 Tax=Anisakis simplex TaxID=6269 RepID=A0A0M3JP59_ANISI
LDMEHEFGKNEKIANALQQKLDALLAEREREKGLVEKLVDFFGLA